MKKRRKIKWKNVFILLIILVLISILAISTIEIIKWAIDNKNTKKQIDIVEEIVEVKEVEDTENTEIIEQPEEIPKTDPYWDFIKMNLIYVDFSELKAINKDVKGWIQVNGTNVNYPFVQTKDNSYYLTRAFDKSYNEAGWIFLDYRNDLDELDSNTIIYGHSRNDKTMFGSLRDVLKNTWYNNSDNYVIKLSTEKTNTLWQVFSIYHIKTTSDYLEINFDGAEDYRKFLDMISNRSMLNFNTSTSTSDKILTLSTCYNKTEKLVIHAKLIKKENR